MGRPKSTNPRVHFGCRVKAETVAVIAKIKKDRKLRSDGEVVDAAVQAIGGLTLEKLKEAARLLDANVGPFTAAITPRPFKPNPVTARPNAEERNVRLDPAPSRLIPPARPVLRMPILKGGGKIL